MWNHCSSGMVNDHVHQVIYGNLHKVFSICKLCGMFHSYVLIRDKVVPVHAMKAYNGSRVTASFAWPQHWVEVNGHLHSQAALPWGKNPPVSIE
jgi:hypothetical protein